MVRFARWISFFLGPIFTLFPIPFILVAKFSKDYSYALKWTIFSYVFIMAVTLFVVMGVMFGVFSNFDVSKREQRPLLFSFCAFAAFCYLLTLLILNGPKVLFIALFAVVFGLIVAVIVNRWIKASIHMATLTSVVLFMGILYKGYFLFLFLLIPLLAWARVKMKEHTPAETVVGTILGIVITLIVYLISKQFFIGLIYS